MAIDDAKLEAIGNALGDELADVLIKSFIPLLPQSQVRSNCRAMGIDIVKVINDVDILGDVAEDTPAVASVSNSETVASTAPAGDTTATTTSTPIDQGATASA